MSDDRNRTTIRNPHHDHLRADRVFTFAIRPRRTQKPVPMPPAACWANMPHGNCSRACRCTSAWADRCGAERPWLERLALTAGAAGSLGFAGRRAAMIR